MSDRCQIALVISAVSTADNFETGEKLDAAYTEVVRIVVEDNVSLYRVVQACRRLVRKVEDEL